MNKFIGIAGDVAAIAGIALCVLSGAARLLGQYAFGGVGTVALFTVGIGVMVFACLAKLHLLTVAQKHG
jgi:hypothetical protein